MNHFRVAALLACLCGATLLSACASLPFGGGAATATNHPRGDIGGPVQSGLRDGIALYNNGDYNGAIRRLGMADVSSGPKATQLEALKYTAFSYCLTSRQTLCRLQFEKALKLDASFDLAPGEHGHPLWGPVFVKAKKTR
ncbi:MAG: TssQ family T6SS-associated lipoprotein [Pseudomonadota bacterium]|nr:TssQ family T6SS-associated lipoprotein [Pseudomonadota bacterium]